MAKVTQNAILDAEGKRVVIGAAVDTVDSYLQRFNALEVKPRSGYDKYFNNDGFINPTSPENLSPQGVAKLMAKLVEVAFQIIGKGGDEAKEMQDALAGIAAYQALAPEKVQKAQETAKLLDALKTLGDSPEAAMLRESLVKRGIVLPEPAANVPAPTVDETTGDNDEEQEQTEEETEEATA